MSISWTADGGHSMLIVGYSTDSERVKDMDPLHGTINSLPYDEFCNNDDWEWYRTYYNNEID